MLPKTYLGLDLSFRVL